MRRLSKLSPVHIFLIIVLIYVTGFLSHAMYLKKTVYGDGIYYFSWLRSSVIDHDSNFTNEYNALGGMQPVAINGLPGNKYSVGPALLWMPAYLAVHALVQGNGYTFPYQLAVGLTSVSAAIFGLLLLWRLLNGFFNTTVSIITIAAVAGTTNLLFYGSVDAVNSHALSFFIACVFLSLIMQKNKQWFAIGITLGFLGIIRTQDFLYGLLLIPFLQRMNILKVITGVFFAFLPQLVAWQYLYGRFWISPYLSGNIEGFNLFRPHLVGVLFGLSSGVYLWTPITLLGTVGLITGKRYLFLTVFLFELYIVSCWSIWWQGASYSGRMLVSSLPVLSFGIASILSWLSRFRLKQAYMMISFILPLSLINVLLIISFLLFVH